MTAPTKEEARVLNYEDAANGLDAIAKDLAMIVRRIDKFIPLLRPEWQTELLCINGMRYLDENAIEAMKLLADNIYEQGKHEARAEEQDR
jgi:hypothetical protein